MDSNFHRVMTKMTPIINVKHVNQLILTDNNSEDHGLYFSLKLLRQNVKSLHYFLPSIDAVCETKCYGVS